MKQEKIDLFVGINKLNEMALDKAHKMLKNSIEEDKQLIEQQLKMQKPEHFTDEQWDYFKQVGEKLLKI